MKQGHDTRSPGKIEDNSAGLGVPSPEQLEERAKELAILDNRSIVTDDDRRNARRELLGEAGPGNDAEGADSMVAAVVTWDEAPGSTGTQAPEILPQDEASIGEQLVEEGMEEALHDEMMEAHKKNIDAAS